MPLPHEGPPAQSLGTSSPQATSAGEREQRASHAQRPPLQIDPAGQRVPAPAHDMPGHTLGID